MIVQIYSLTSVADVRACERADVDHVGVAAGDQDLPASISNEQARRIFEATTDSTKTVALTVDTDPDRVSAYARALQPDILHLSQDVAAFGVDAVEAVREDIPQSIDLMRAIDVSDERAVDVAKRFERHCDWFLLDTATEAVEGIGASGETHDWEISRQVVQATETPTILAGGLSPENVAEAVRTVEPAGVDSYTHTSRTERRKDPESVRAFARAARLAAEKL